MENLLSIEQLTELIQINRSTLYEWTHCGFILHYKFPNRVRFKELDIEEWLKCRERKSYITYKVPIDGRYIDKSYP